MSDLAVWWIALSTPDKLFGLSGFLARYRFDWYLCFSCWVFKFWYFRKVVINSTNFSNLNFVIPTAVLKLECRLIPSSVFAVSLFRLHIRQKLVSVCQSDVREMVLVKLPRAYKRCLRSFLDCLENVILVNKSLVFNWNHLAIAQTSLYQLVTHFKHH